MHFSFTHPLDDIKENGFEIENDQKSIDIKFEDNPSEAKYDQNCFDIKSEVDSYDVKSNLVYMVNKCNICHEIFTSESALKEHIYVVHEEKKPVSAFKCHLCDTVHND